MKKLTIALFGIALLSLSGCDQMSLGAEPESASVEGREVVALESAAPVVLDVRNDVGEIILRGAEPGDARAITVVYRLTAFGETQADAAREASAMRVTVSQSAGRVAVNAVQTQFRDHPRTNTVDLTITVPRSIDLVVRNDVGAIDVRGVQAPDQLDLTTAVGDITLSEVEAGPRTRIVCDVGDIAFAGSLSRLGGATLQTNVGKLDLRLPEDTAAALDARTTVGSITLRGLSASQRTLSEEVPGATLTATLGEGGPTLKLSSEVGSITLAER